MHRFVIISKSKLQIITMKNITHLMTSHKGIKAFQNHSYYIEPRMLCRRLPVVFR